MILISRLLSFSALSLIAANLIPLIGALLLDWSVFLIIFLFWTENLIIGIFNIFKIILAQGEGSDIAKKIFTVPFFLIHYGGFCAGHGVFVISVFGKWANADLKDFHNFIQDIFIDEKAIYAVLALFVSHGLSFIYNYIQKGERKKATIDKLMTAPYSRILILHLTLIFGAFLVIQFKTPEAGLALLIILKIGVDLSAHLKERSRFAVMKKA
ncbi:MAG: DUF6498-containing protein [Candidatus Aminicenantes bacterium]